MNEPNPAVARPRFLGIRTLAASARIQRVAAVLAGFLLASGAAAWYWSRPAEQPASAEPQRPPETVEEPTAAAQPGLVRLSPAQQEAIGLRTARVTSGAAVDVLTAPGRVAPNEAQYAYITPRAAGVVRSVNAHVGQDVKAGDLLATIDSPEVGSARLELYTRLQTLEVAHSQADWQQTIYKNTLDLIDRLRKGETPEQIHNAFEDRAVGENREKLMTAYAEFRLARATIERNRELFAQKLITPKQFEHVNADYEVAQATYQSLMDQMGYEVRLANTRAQQALKQAETSVRAAQEHLRILGVKPDGTEPEVAQGKVIGVKPDGTLPAEEEKTPAREASAETILPAGKDHTGAAVKPVGAAPEAEAKAKDAPVSTYSIWAPFDGTILERELIVPGVAVDTTHRIFTLANLSTVWVEASVHENDFNLLAKARGGKVRFRSPAYPGRVFDGEVIYAGDLVEEKSRAVQLLARANNPDRLLKPGMFVDVEVLSEGTGTVSLAPVSALLTEGARTFVFVRKQPNLFVRKDVESEPPRGELVTIRRGLEPGDEVVTSGGETLNALAIQGASSAG